jgi:hypothetical protein
LPEIRPLHTFFIFSTLILPLSYSFSWEHLISYLHTSPHHRVCFWRSQPRIPINIVFYFVLPLPITQISLLPPFPQHFIFFLLYNFVYCAIPTLNSLFFSKQC